MYSFWRTVNFLVVLVCDLFFCFFMFLFPSLFVNYWSLVLSASSLIYCFIHIKLQYKVYLKIT
jgi:hypothetical protein